MNPSPDDLHWATAMQFLNVDDYWPESEGVCENELEGIDQKYNIHNLFELLVNNMMNSYALINIDNNVDELEASYSRTALSLVAEKMEEFQDSFTNRSNDFEVFAFCLAYMHRYAGCYAAMVRDVLKTAFHVHPSDPIKRFLSLKDSLEVVSLGGGPGNDLVGFCSALCGKHHGINKMELISVDKHFEWERFFTKTWSLLHQEYSSEANVVLNDVEVHKYFVRADLTKQETWNTYLEDKLKSADVLLLVKVLCLIPDADVRELLENIVQRMKPGALLVFIDRPFPEEEFEAVEYCLECVYQQPNQRFNFDFASRNSSRPILTSCHSCASIYMKKFIES